MEVKLTGEPYEDEGFYTTEMRKSDYPWWIVTRSNNFILSRSNGTKRMCCLWKDSKISVRENIKAKDIFTMLKQESFHKGTR